MYSTVCGLSSLELEMFHTFTYALGSKRGTVPVWRLRGKNSSSIEAGKDCYHGRHSIAVNFST